MGTSHLMLILFWTFLLQYLSVDCHPTIQCAHTGTGASSLDLSRRWNKRSGPFTIGAKNFDSDYGGAMYSGFKSFRPNEPANVFKDEKKECPYEYKFDGPKEKYGNSHGELELCDETNERAILRVNQVQQTDSDGKKYTLAGWLHLELELTNKSDQIRMIYAQMYDELYNAVGEFVTDPTEQCQASNPNEYLNPTPYQYLPCSAAGAREAKTSSALYVVAKQDIVEETVKTSPKYLPAKELTSAHGVHFTWRMNEYWCSRHVRVVPMVFVLTTSNIEKWKVETNNGASGAMGLFRLLRKIPKYWLRPIWFGAADVKHPDRGPLECNKPVIDENTADPSPSDAPWILKKVPNIVTDEYTHSGNLYTVVFIPGYPYNTLIKGSATCQVNPYAIQGLHTSPAYGGRCKMSRSNDVSSTYYQSCNTDKSAPEFQGLNITFQTYGSYVTNLHSSRNETCFNPCRAPEGHEDALNISEIKTGSVSHNRTDLRDQIFDHETRTRESIAKFWRGRKFHGILCVIVSMFLMPVSLFAARYYKETFMKCQCKGAHLWYWIHLATTTASMAILFSSQTGLSQSIESWGRSQHIFGIIHDFVGWASHMVFIILFIMGGLRGVNMPIRKFLMTAHSVAGFIHYIINLLLIAVSTMIPASPSLAECGGDGLPTGFSPVLLVLIGWVFCDGSFHGVLTTLMLGTDVQLKIKRWYCPIVPFLNPSSHSDLRGAVLRKLLFLLYIILSAVFTIGTILLLVLRPPPRGCGFGEMSCKSSLGCSKAGLALCKKLLYSNCK